MYPITQHYTRKDAPVKYSISDAARIAGITRKTFYKHIDKKGISVEKDNDNNPQVDASELIRIYGSDLNFDAAGNTSVTGQGTQVETPQSSNDQSHEVELLKQHIKFLEDQKEHFETLYKQERDDRRAGMLLLTDEREKQSQWEQSFSDLKAQVISQRNSQEELEKFKILAHRKVRQLKQELKEEKEKSLIKKLFIR